MKQCLLALILGVSLAAPVVCAEELRLTAVDHSAWDALLKTYVSETSRVDYERWAGEGLAQLDDYLTQIAHPGTEAPDSAASKALLINAYNALTVRWILEHFPVPSIWSTPDPFKKVRHTVGGLRLSLDQLESLLRDMGDPRIHAALVCAARSCPPLRREAYSAERIDEQLDDNTRRWLANADLNRFDTKTAEARVSPSSSGTATISKTTPGASRAFCAAMPPLNSRQHSATAN